MPDYTLEEEIKDWEGFSWSMRRPEREIWDKMMSDVMQFKEAVAKTDKPLTTDPFFMAVLFSQWKTIKWLQAELKRLSGVTMEPSSVQTTLDPTS